ncbi:MAG: peptide chain release factor N(5)-glutamine methyltransferase [Alphaproteobacteria bacterium]
MTAARIAVAEDGGADATVGTALAAAAERLRQAGVDEAPRDARLLLAAAAGWSSAVLYGFPERSLTPDAARRFAGFVARRALREPVARILGRRGFWAHEFAVAPAVLDPRPDSELLVAEALARLPADRPGVAVDLGVGSGCLLLSVLAERPLLRGVGVDISAAALAVARGNAAALGLDARTAFLQGDWCAALAPGIADCVLANPPYVESGAIAGLEPEVRGYDPGPALDGGADGLSAYRALAPQLAMLLAPGGHAVVEIGWNQADAVSALLVSAGLERVERRCDLAGHDRCLIATHAAR